MMKHAARRIFWWVCVFPIGFILILLAFIGHIASDTLDWLQDTYDKCD